MKKRMKMMMMLGLLGLAGGVSAQDTAAPQERQLKAEAEKDAAKSQADEAKKRAELAEARKRLDEAARQVAELSTQLAQDEGGNVMFLAGGPPHAVLGVQIDVASGKQGARVMSVSPGGAAEEAGIQKDDVIVSLDGKGVAGTEDPNRAVVDYMRGVKPDQKVKVRVLRAGKNKDFVVTARPMPMFGQRMFNVRVPEGAMGAVTAMPPMPAMPGMPGMPMTAEFHTFWPGEFGGMELASITPKLGAYFGASSGVLVVQAPDSADFKLEDGDVIQGIDGRKPEDGAHAMRILRSYKPGEKLTLAVLRQRKPLSLAVTMPDRPEFGGDVLMREPPMPPMPPLPPVPAVPRNPDGAGTTD